MGVQARLAASVLDVEPGGSAAVRATIRNTGNATDRFTAEVAHGTTAWGTVSPPSLSLLPFEEGTVTITFAPPRAPGVMAGPTRFALRVTSAEDPADHVVEEGTVNVGAFSDVVAELVPRSTRGRQIGRAQLAVDNRSNVAYRAELSGSDPEMALGVVLTPPLIEVGPGQVGFARVAVRPRRSLWRGVAISHAFSVLLREARPAGTGFFGDEVLPSGADVGRSGGAEPPRPPMSAGPTAPLPALGLHPAELVVEGTMLQDAMVPPRTGGAAAVLAVVVLVVLLGWFTLVKPQISSAVHSQVQRQLTASGIAPSSTGSGTVPSRGTVSGAPNGTGGLSVNGSLLAAGNGTQAYTVPNGKTLQITDLLLQNAAGDAGIVALARNDTVLMQFSMANFRDLDYHWITPIVFGPGSQVQLMVSGCTDTCTPGIYYAGSLVPASGS